MRLSTLAVSVALCCTHFTLSVPAFADDWDEEDEDDEEEEDDEDDVAQPPVTAGGMYRKDNYPIAALERPLTLNRQLLQMRAGLEVDLSAKSILKNWRLRLQAQYGVTDAIQVNLGIDQKVAGSFGVDSLLTFGMEMAIVYNLVDFRVSFELPVSPCCEFDVAVGVPIRYLPKPQIAIIALDKLVTFHTGGEKPDLTVGAGVIFQALPPLAIIGRGELILTQFDPELMRIPVGVAAQFTPTSAVDLGVEFTFGDLKNEEDPIAQRSLMLFLQLRL